MTDIAITATATTASSRAASRRSATGGDGASPFAALLEARDAKDAAAVDKRAKAERPDEPQKSEKSHKSQKSDQSSSAEASNNDDDQDDAGHEPAKAGDAGSQLPPWLLALRNPSAEAPTPSVPVTDPTAPADPVSTINGVAGLAGFIRGVATTPSGKTGGTQPTPPTQAPKDLPASALGAAGDASDSSGQTPALNLAVALAGDATAATADAVLSPSQTAALTATLDKLAAQIAPSNPADITQPVNVEPLPGLAATATPTRTPTITAPLTPQAAGAALLNAFGEPLALNQSDAGTRLGERLRWLHEAGVQEARLQLHPRELGSVDIRIRIEGQNANVWFGADHPGARAALEAALPQLRERFAADGLALSQAQVGARDFASSGQSSGQSGGQSDGQMDSQAGHSSRERDASASGVDARSLDATSSRDAVERRQVGLVDRYV